MERKVHPLLKKGVKLPLFNKPPVIKPPSLPLARQWYLFDEIRHFVSPEYCGQQGFLGQVIDHKDKLA